MLVPLIRVKGTPQRLRPSPSTSGEVTRLPISRDPHLSSLLPSQFPAIGEAAGDEALCALMTRFCPLSY